ncbi:MAG TPA: hypothetical protein VFO35_10050 [Steroidobacteraceae bacterium]|nr:hypothetical protein [Steroidobacteraceae bacterium]
MFELASDWNYATAGIYAESAFFFRERGAQKFIFGESAFLPAGALTPPLRGAQTRITTSELLDEPRAEPASKLCSSIKSRRENRGTECQPTN